MVSFVAGSTAVVRKARQTSAMKIKSTSTSITQRNPRGSRKNPGEPFESAALDGRAETNSTVTPVCGKNVTSHHARNQMISHCCGVSPQQIDILEHSPHSNKYKPPTRVLCLMSVFHFKLCSYVFPTLKEYAKDEKVTRHEIIAPQAKI